ncbi:hypothetical protein ACF3M1_09335 [Luteimonas sp. WGS1318]|uniref:hypothetical protein n=1 Tax=Luteimonas sp. WGS1318 TaxID=3366815 RepID=UPI00372D3E2F
MNADDIELCRIYGQLSREYLADKTWDQCVHQLAEGWLRVRRSPSLEWQRAEPLVRTFWDLTRG